MPRVSVGTNFDYPIFVQGVPVMGGSLMTQGNSFFVKPRTGSDSNDGMSPDSAFKTLSYALSQATANQNDVIYMMAEGNTAGNTTDYQSATLAWNKDMVHLIGVTAPTMVGQRARIAAISTFAPSVSTPLITWSANNCIMSNIHVFYGVNSANAIGAIQLTGNHNYFYNCDIAGIGHDTMDVSGAYSLQISGGQENTFDACNIGLDTIARGTAVNAEISLVSGATRNMFKNCHIITYAEANTHEFVKVPVNGIDRYTIFENCIFMNMPTGIASGTTMLEAFDITGGGSPDGLILVKNCSLIGAPHWEAATVSGKTIVEGPVTTAATSGLALVTA